MNILFELIASKKYGSFYVTDRKWEKRIQLATSSRSPQAIFLHREAIVHQAASVQSEPTSGIN